MAEITTSPIATSAGHWYDRQGRQVETVPGASGKPVEPDIRHARKLGLLPGVTSVLKVQDRPGLTKWLIDQALMSALTLPKIEGESLDEFKNRAKTDSQEQTTKSADKGKDGHTALEMAVQGKPVSEQWMPHVKAVDDALRGFGVDFLAGEPERSFAHHLGFGGRNDWHSVKQKVLLDYKFKQNLESKKLAYDEHVQQLAACAAGLVPSARLLSVFVGIEDVQVRIEEWEQGEIVRGWEMFRCCLRLWQLKNKYDSSFIKTQQDSA